MGDCNGLTDYAYFHSLTYVTFCDPIPLDDKEQTQWLNIVSVL